MADEPNRDDEQPDKDAQAVIDQLKKEGNTFENLEEKVDPVKKEPPEDKPAEDEAELAKQKQEEEANKVKAAEEEEKRLQEISSRESRKANWQIEMEKRRARQEERKESEVLEIVKSLKTEIEDLKKGKAPAEKLPEDTAKRVEAIKEKYADVSPDFIDELVSLFPKKDDTSSETNKKLDELAEKVKEFEGLKTDRKKESEDIEYSKSFKSKITPLLKQDFPKATEADISAIEQKLHEAYFDDRYIKLGIEEIYAIKRDNLSQEVSPEHRQAGELGKRGTGRDTTMIDYDNVSEEDFNKMSQEEQAKVIEYKSKSSRL